MWSALGSREVSDVRKTLYKLSHPPLSAEARSAEWCKVPRNEIADRYHVDEIWTVQVSREWYLVISRGKGEYMIHDIVRRNNRNFFKRISER